MAAQGRIDEAVEQIELGKRAYRRWTDSLLPEWQCGVHWFAGDFRRALTCAREFDAGWLYELTKRRALGVVFAALAAVEAGEIERAQQYQSEPSPRVRRARVDVFQPSSRARRRTSSVDRRPIDPGMFHASRRRRSRAPIGGTPVRRDDVRRFGASCRRAKRRGERGGSRGEPRVDRR
jgi:hypothetical protein